MHPPTNTSPESAFVLNGQVPLDATIDLRGLANPQRVWFKYTLGTWDFGMATYATGDDGFHPKFQFRFNDPLSAPYQSGSNEPVEAFLEESVGVAAVGSSMSRSKTSSSGARIALFITSLSIQVMRTPPRRSGR
jgi:hypothetical protein